MSNKQKKFRWCIYLFCRYTYKKYQFLPMFALKKLHQNCADVSNCTYHSKLGARKRVKMVLHSQFLTSMYILKTQIAKKISARGPCLVGLVSFHKFKSTFHYKLGFFIQILNFSVHFRPIFSPFSALFRTSFQFWSHFVPILIQFRSNSGQESGQKRHVFF